MIERICDAATRVAEALSGAMFLCLIVAVALQVLARNVLQAPMLWTSDVAQLLFSWLIFVGAAIGFRKGAHYAIDLLPRSNPLLQTFLDWLGVLAALAVIYILVFKGWNLTMIRSSGEIQSLGVSRLWLYLPIPVSGALMALYLVEHVRALLRGAQPA